MVAGRIIAILFVLVCIAVLAGIASVLFSVAFKTIC
jgi:hypothetical protein